MDDNRTLEERKTAWRLSALLAGCTTARADEIARDKTLDYLKEWASKMKPFFEGLPKEIKLEPRLRG